MNIKALREAAGLEQKELADKIGTNRSSISHYETGITTPSMAVMVRLAIVLGFDLNELKLEPTRQVKEKAPSQAVTERGERLLRRLQRRHKEMAADIKELAELIAERRRQGL